METNRTLVVGTYVSFAFAAALGACSSGGTNASSVNSGAEGEDAATSIQTSGEQEADASSNETSAKDSGKKDSTGTVADDAAQASPAAGGKLIAAGLGQTCSALPNGNAKCWGHGWFGGLGNGVHGANSDVPVDVLNVSSVQGLAAGKNFACAIVGGGAVKCWGDGEYGQLGNGMDGGISPTPVSVVGITGATAIATGNYHACAIVAGGTVKCWGGFDTMGAIGGGVANSTVPIDSGYTGAVRIAAGAHHTCAAFSNGTVRCWGFNPWGAVTGATPDTDVVDVSSHDSTACALHANGTVSCWGTSKYGQAGSSPLQPVAGVANATAIAVGYGHVCALTSGGTVTCWGANYAGQCGRGSNDEALAPGLVPGITGAESIAAGESHTCVRFPNGTAKCWGMNNGTLGNGTNTISINTPVDVLNLP